MPTGTPSKTPQTLHSPKLTMRKTMTKQCHNNDKTMSKQ